MYKYLLLLLTSVIFNFSNAQNKTTQLIDNALEKAKLEKKYVFVNYFSESSELSKKLSKQLNNEEHRDLLEKSYVFVDIAIPNEQMGSNSKENRVPFWYILDDAGNFIDISIDSKGNNISYPKTKKSVDKFMKILEKTSKMSESQLTSITNSFHNMNTNAQFYSSK
ncbi:hypothetical protein [Tenacibaculum sp. M341]|uniref:hypothetical protein n=1 Tax=Tenacibaculum sp. M341 TaxID=2530339 RepID=UPI00104E4853|nr:hypothetical protein [Tenacibaculum sp. M341]TCI92722.1 hypothetical protein EYW44_07445 [Tenacibaculum sp. M341]